MQQLKISRALLSVTNKTGLWELASFLAANGVELVSTGGTRKALIDRGLAVVPVSEVTGFPEILDGRVKTLHPHIHAGILANKDEPVHMETLAAMRIAAFDLVCVNLYDFQSALAAQKTLAETIEQIDIGGPCLMRAAAKNFQSVLILPDPEFYQAAIGELQRNAMSVGLSLRKAMAAKAFRQTAQYDSLIAAYLQGAS